jgi:hypothetical protein
MVPEVPVMVPFTVPVTVWTVPVVVLVVKVTVAVPVASVAVLDAGENEPPLVLVHATETPETGLPPASRTTPVIATVPPAVTSDAPAVTTTDAGGPATKVTEAVPVSGLPPSVPLIVADPTVEEAVRVAVYVPLPLSVTAERDPPVVASVTVPPLADRLFPCWSLSWTVMVEVDVPFAVSEVGLATMVEVATEAGPARVVIALLVPDTVPSFAVTVCEVPELVLTVKVTVATPLALVAELGAEKEPPPVLLQFTVRPASSTGVSAASAS